MQTKVNHLGVLVKALLPDSRNFAAVTEQLDSLLGEEEEDEDEDGGLTLPLIRMQAIKQNAHDLTWDNNFVPAYMYTVGDIGYIPGGEDFNSFVVLKNVIKDNLVLLDTVQEIHGTHHPHTMGRMFARQELQSFPAPGGFYGYAVLTGSRSVQN